MAMNLQEVPTVAQKISKITGDGLPQTVFGGMLYDDKGLPL